MEKTAERIFENVHGHSFFGPFLASVRLFLRFCANLGFFTFLLKKLFEKKRENVDF
jgi:hypothetical protein